MEIINLHSWLLKMPAMRKFKVHSSERKSRKIIVSLACVYHYCSCLRLPLLPEPNLNTPVFLATNEILCFPRLCSTSHPAYFHVLIFFWSLEMPFYFANRGLSNQSFDFSSSHVWMWELDFRKSWALMNSCVWTLVLRRLLRVPWTAGRSTSPS